MDHSMLYRTLIAIGLAYWVFSALFLLLSSPGEQARRIAKEAIHVWLATMGGLLLLWLLPEMPVDATVVVVTAAGVTVMVGIAIAWHACTGGWTVVVFPLRVLGLLLGATRSSERWPEPAKLQLRAWNLVAFLGACFSVVCLAAYMVYAALVMASS